MLRLTVEELNNTSFLCCLHLIKEEHVCMSTASPISLKALAVLLAIFQQSFSQYETGNISQTGRLLDQLA